MKIRSLEAVLLYADTGTDMTKLKALQVTIFQALRTSAPRIPAKAVTRRPGGTTFRGVARRQK